MVNFIGIVIFRNNVFWGLFKWYLRDVSWYDLVVKIDG